MAWEGRGAGRESTPLRPAASPTAELIKSTSRHKLFRNALTALHRACSCTVPAAASGRGHARCQRVINWPCIRGQRRVSGPSSQPAGTMPQGALDQQSGSPGRQAAGGQPATHGLAWGHRACGALGAHAFGACASLHRQLTTLGGGVSIAAALQSPDRCSAGGKIGGWKNGDQTFPHNFGCTGCHSMRPPPYRRCCGMQQYVRI